MGLICSFSGISKLKIQLWITSIRATQAEAIGANRRYRVSRTQAFVMLTPIATGKSPLRAVTTNVVATMVLKAMDTTVDVIHPLSIIRLFDISYYYCRIIHWCSTYFEFIGVFFFFIYLYKCYDRIEILWNRYSYQVRVSKKLEYKIYLQYRKWAR